jgi:WD40 repeat protein
MRVGVDFSGSMQVLRLSPGGTRLALAENGGAGTEVRVIDVPSGREVARYAGLGGVQDMAFRSERDLLVVHGADCWQCDVARGSHTVVRKGQVEQDGPLYCLGVSPDGRTLALGANRELLLWDSRRKRLKRSLTVPSGLVAVGWACGAAFSPDGRCVAAFCPPGDYLDRMMCFVGVWDVSSGKRVRVVKLGGRGCAAFRPDDRVLAVGWEGSVLLYDLREPRPPRVNVDELFMRDLVYATGWTEPVGHHRIGSPVTSLGFSADGKVVRVGCSDGLAVLLNARTGRVTSRATAPADQGEVRAATINAGGLAAGAVEGNVVLVWQVPRWGAGQ